MNNYNLSDYSEDRDLTELEQDRLMNAFKKALEEIENSEMVKQQKTVFKRIVKLQIDELKIIKAKYRLYGKNWMQRMQDER